MLAAFSGKNFVVHGQKKGLEQFDIPRFVIDNEHTGGCLRVKRCCRFHYVASVFASQFRLSQRLLRNIEKGFRVLGIFREGGDADAHGQLVEKFILDGDSYSFRNRKRGGAVGLDQ